VMAQSLVEGTVLLIAGLVCAGQRPWMLITGASGGSSAGFSSRFNNEGGVACGVGVAVGAAAGVEAGFCFFEVCASAIDVRKMQIISLRIIVGFLSPCKGSQAAIS